MSKQDKTPRSGFVIKLSSETAQKLAVEDQQAKEKASVDASSSANPSEDVTIKKIDERLSQLSKDSKKPSLKVEEGETTESTNVSEKDISTDAQKREDVNKDKVIVKGDNKDEGDAKNASWGDYAQYITYEGEDAVYTDPSSQQKYSWSVSSKSWVPKSGDTDTPGRVYSYENDTHVYTEGDGSKYFWDIEKKAWLPKIDDDFLAYYQMSYGFVDNSPDVKDKSGDSKEKTDDKQEQKKVDPAAVKRKSEPQWFQPSEETNTKVYVSNLPNDLTEEEFVNFMQKCGLVERDPSSQKMKVKLYMNKEYNCFKGDALCTYIKIESVDLALKLLDGSDFKGNKIKVERAHFQLKGEYNPALKPKKKKKKELEKLKKMQQKLFDWRPEKFIGERSKHERVVIVKNLFHPTDFDKDVSLILDYQQDMREECSKCGEVRKVVIYDRHPEGVAQITMKEPEQADEVVQLINGRWFGKKQITAEIWDGRTKYRIAETDADISKRIDKWDKFLEQAEENKSSESKDKEVVGTEVKEVVDNKKEVMEVQENSDDKKSEE